VSGAEVYCDAAGVRGGSSGAKLQAASTDGSR